MNALSQKRWAIVYGPGKIADDHGSSLIFDTFDGLRRYWSKSYLRKHIKRGHPKARVSLITISGEITNPVISETRLPFIDRLLIWLGFRPLLTQTTGS